jgi:hypothetical protein
MSDLVKRDTDGWAAVLPAVGDLAGKVAQTEFVPDAMRGKPAVVAAAILYGRELGLEPMTSLRSVNIIKGRPALTAEAMRAMVLAAGHDIRFQEMTSARCIIVGRRKGQDDTTTVTFTMDDAKKMGVGGGQQYAKMPRQMLAARATSELCRLIFADVIGGLISDVEAEDADPGETLATVTPMTTARRKSPVKAEAKAPEPAPPTPTDDEPVLDDDVIEAEIVDETPETPQAEPEPEPVLDAVDQAIANVTEVMDAEVIEERVTGMAAARAALNEAKAGKPTGPITAKQLKALQAGFVACGITDRDERLSIAASLAGRPDLASANDLTAAEAKDVLDGLGFAQATDNPRATLKEATS